MVKTNYDFLNDDIKRNVEDKIKSSIFITNRLANQSLEVFINSTEATTIWNQYLNNSRRTVRRTFRFNHTLIPQPEGYHRDQYALYERDLDDYIENYLVQHGHHNIYGHVFNLGTALHPQMYLVLSEGPLRREHLGAWAQNWSDEEEARGGAPPSASSLASRMEPRNISQEAGYFKNGASTLEMDTYLLQKRLAELTRNPTERARPPSPPSSSVDPNPNPDPDEVTVSSLSEGDRDSDEAENLPHDAVEVQLEEADVVNPAEGDVIAPVEAEVEQAGNAAASDGESKPEAEIENEGMVEEGHQPGFAPGEDME